MENNNFLDGLLEEIRVAKEKGKIGIFKINMKIPDNTVKGVKKHLEEIGGYDVEIKKCISCRGTWDILIYFRKF